MRARVVLRDVGCETTDLARDCRTLLTLARCDYSAANNNLRLHGRSRIACTRVHGKERSCENGKLRKRWVIVALVGVLAVLAARHLIDRGEPPDLAPRVSSVRLRARPVEHATPKVAPDELAQPEVPARRIAGRVIFDGAPVAGATVALDVVVPTYEAIGAVASQRIAEVKSGADGGFDLGVQPAARFAIDAHSDGPRAGGANIDLADPRVDPENVVVVLRQQPPPRRESDGDASLVGRVIDDDGRAVPGARVVAVTAHFFGFAGMTARWSATDDGGHFAIDGLVPGFYSLTASGRGVASDVSTTALAAPGASDEIVLMTVRRARVRGRLTMGGAAVAGVRIVVAASARTGDRRQLQSYTQRDGRFVIDGVAFGRVELTATGHTLEQRWFVVDRLDGTEVALEAEAPCSIRGRVHEHGRPATGSVFVSWQQGSATAVLDTDGGFEIAGIPAGIVRVSAACRETRYELPPGETRMIDLDGACPPTAIYRPPTSAPLRDGRIAGRVLDEGGDPMPGVRVSAPGGQGITDEAGHFDFATRAFAETFTVWANVFDGASAHIDDVSAGTEIEIRFRRGSIAGDVAGFGVVPIVTAQSAFGGKAVEARVDDDEFAFPDLQPGTYWVEGHAGTDVDGKIVVVLSGEVARVELSGRHDGRTLHGHVLDLATHVALPGMACQLAAVGPTGASFADMPVAITDGDGQFSLTATSHVWSAGVIACWSPRGPLSPVTATPLPRWYGGAGDPDDVALVATRAHPGGYAGFVVAPLTLPLAVAMVDAGSPAERSGLAAGDRILAIDGQPADGLLPQAAMWKIWAHPAGSVLALRVDRRGATSTIRIIVAP
jgi:hypothetical protein